MSLVPRSVFMARSRYTTRDQAFSRLAKDYAATVALAASEISYKETYVDLAELTGNLTLNITAVSNSNLGDIMYVFLDADSTDRNVTLGTNFDTAVPSFMVKASSELVLMFMFNGTSFFLVNKDVPEATQTLTGAGAVSVAVKNTLLVTTGANALTLAAGYEGQEKFIKMKTDGGDGTLTPNSLQGGTTITFNDAGDFWMGKYLDGKWNTIVNSGCTIA